MAAKAQVDITAAQRSIFWLNDDYIVVYGRATSKNAGLFKRFNLSLVTNPQISGQTATETMADGQLLFIHTLLPENASITAREAASDLNPIADLKPAKYVPTVENVASPTGIRFLHVLQGADHGVNATAVSSFTSTSGTTFDGALVGTTALMFIHSSAHTASFASTVFSELATVKGNYVAGLKPGTGYKIVKTLGGATTKVTITAGAPPTLTQPESRSSNSQHDSHGRTRSAPVCMRCKPTSYISTITKQGSRRLTGCPVCFSMRQLLKAS